MPVGQLCEGGLEDKRADREVPALRGVVEDDFRIDVGLAPEGLEF